MPIEQDASGFEWELLEDTWKLKSYKGSALEVRIPPEHEGRPVSYIGAHAFEDCRQIEQIEIPSNVVLIGDFAFADCRSLQSIRLPDSVTSLRFNVFRNCVSLVEVKLPATMQAIGDFTFYGCTSLKTLEIPPSVNFIGENAFCGCSSLVSVEIPPLVDTIARSTFYACESLTSVSVTTNIKTVLTHAFEACPKLERVTLVGERPEATITAFQDFNFTYLVADEAIARHMCTFDEVQEFLVPDRPANHRRVRDPRIVSEEQRKADKALIAQRRMLFACRVVASYPQRVGELSFKKKKDLLLCLSRSGCLEELRVFEDKPGFFTHANLSACVDVASKNSQLEVVAYLMECLAKEQGPSASLGLGL